MEKDRGQNNEFYSLSKIFFLFVKKCLLFYTQKCVTLFMYIVKVELQQTWSLFEKRCKAKLPACDCHSSFNWINFQKYKFWQLRAVYHLCLCTANANRISQTLLKTKGWVLYALPGCPCDDALLPRGNAIYSGPFSLWRSKQYDDILHNRGKDWVT